MVPCKLPWKVPCKGGWKEPRKGTGIGIGIGIGYSFFGTFFLWITFVGSRLLKANSNQHPQPGRGSLPNLAEDQGAFFLALLPLWQPSQLQGFGFDDSLPAWSVIKSNGGAPVLSDQVEKRIDQ